MNLNETIPAYEAAESLIDACEFTNDTASPHTIADADNLDESAATFILSVCREQPYGNRGRIQRFKVTVEPIED
jgi:hypothetical protein